MLTGDPGAGKTMLLRACAADRTDVLLYRGEVVNSPLSLLKALLAQLGLVWHGGTRVGFMAFRQLARKAGCTAVLVDDAQRLTRSTPDMLRAIHEGTGLAVVLAGTRRVGRKLVRKREELAQRDRRSLARARAG